MRYRFKISERTHKQRNSSECVYILRGKNRLRKNSNNYSDQENIDLSALFELRELPEQKDKKVKKHKSRNKKLSSFLIKLRKAYTKAVAFYVKLTENISKRADIYLRKLAHKVFATRKEKKINTIPLLSGMLCAALTVSFLSVGGVLFGLFSPYNRSFTEVKVPDFMQKLPNDVLSDDQNVFNIIIKYEYNPEAKLGTVISQVPRAGVTRRIYEKNGYCNISLTVSKGKEPYILDDLSGMSKRDAELILKNNGIKCSWRDTPSDSIKKGTVITSYPSKGTSLSEGSEVILQISAGKQTSQVIVPYLIGLTETQATSRLRSAGLFVGNISYQNSSAPAGTVIAQDISPYSHADEGSKISLTVSAGEKYSPKTIPDLYGMSLIEAITKLKEFGLTVGSTYSANNAAPKGTIVAQEPIAGTPITSSTVSVDLFISS